MVLRRTYITLVQSELFKKLFKFILDGKARKKH